MVLLERRIGLLFAIFLVLLALAGARTLWLGGVKGSSLSSAAASQQVTSAKLPAERGAILDRKGRALAVSPPADDVSATPYLVRDPVRVAQRLAPLLDRSVDELVKELARRDTGFVYLARDVAADRAARIKRLKIEGIAITVGFQRVYPRRHLAAQVIGSVGTDGDALGGLEYSRDALLVGRDGERRLVKDALGESINVRDTVPSRRGSNLRLTIDSAVQEKVEEVLGGVGQAYRPRGATALVMDPRSGDIIAMANWPRIDANRPGAAPAYALQNRSVGFTHEPGSTFKSITVAGALQDGTVTPDTTFLLPPTIQVADREIGEAHGRGTVTLNTGEILAQSSNVGAIKIGLEMGAKRFDQWVRRFGFGRPTDVGLPGEERGIILPLERYSGSSMGNLPIGQGLAVTPLQLASAYAAIANGGMLRPPRVISAIDGRRVAARRGRRVISSTTAAQVRRMLAGAFAPGGTASEVEIPGYALAGKTGTANKIDAATGEYSEERYIASFVGFAPALHPKLLISVTVDEPKGDIYGATVAAPAFEKIASFALPSLGIAPK